MTVITDRPARVRSRPGTVKFIAGVLIFLGVTAFAGGFELVTGLWMTDPFPSGTLDKIPLIGSWVIPGLVLGLGFGLGSLVAAYGLLRQPRWSWLGWLERLTGYHWSWAATILIGLGHVVWIGLEFVYLAEPSWLEAVYGTVGLILLLMPMLPLVRRHFKA